jgi:hypothetical protein
VPSRHFMLNWDPGNAAKRGEVPYPGGLQSLTQRSNWPLPRKGRDAK